MEGEAGEIVDADVMMINILNQQDGKIINGLCRFYEINGQLMIEIKEIVTANKISVFFMFYFL